MGSCQYLLAISGGVVALLSAARIGYLIGAKKARRDSRPNSERE